MLGHRRLAIIDLSNAGAQPMSALDGTLHLILNGEIYNHVELRVELEGLGHRFRSHSDSEVLLAAWAAWGLGALDRLVGMFAFALLDERQKRLYLVRDQFAMKPLYYATTRDGLAFASEIPPLLALPGVRRTADSDALADFLVKAVNNHVGRTMFADVRELPGAHLAEIALDAPLQIEPRRYWSPPTTQTSDASFAEATTEVRRLLEESVRLHFRSDVPVGLLLSGGQDSTSLLAVARHVMPHGTPLHTFSYRGGAGAFDEGPFIDAARESAGAIGHEIRVTPDEWAADLSALITSQGEPFGSPVIYMQHRLYGAAAAAGMRVVLDGQGSDEYFAGYDRFRSGRLASLLRPGSFRECARVASGYAAGGARWGALARGTLSLRWPALSRFRRRRSSSPLLDGAWLAATGSDLSTLQRPVGPDVLREMLRGELTAPSIPWLMRYADRNAMAFSIENRQPYLTPPLVEYVLGLPEAHFIGADGLSKQLLRESVRDIVPALVRGRRAKVGFDVPLPTWLSRTPNLLELLEESCEIPAVSRSVAQQLAQGVREARPLSRPMAFNAWRLATLAAWAREFSVEFA